MSREIHFQSVAFGQLQEWGKNNDKLAARILRLIVESGKTPFDGTGKPEPLKGDYQGCWSRRIDEEHRLIYKVSNDEILIISMRGHYP